MENRECLTHNADLDLCDNKISTSKYTCLTFLPKNLMLQFSKLANIYFLVFSSFLIS